MMEADAIPPATGLQVRTREPLIWLHGAGHETRGDSGYYHDSSRRGGRRHVNLQLTLAGEGFYQNRRGRWTLPPGVAYMDVIPGPFEYGFQPGSRRPYEHVFVSLAGPVAMRWHKRLVASFGNVLHLGRSSPVEAIMLGIAHAREAGTLPDRYLLSGQLYQLIMTLYSTLRSSRVNTNPRISRAVEIIARRAAERSLDVESLARALGCSREYLSRQFREVMGVTPSEYLMHHRVRLAARLLREGDDKLDAVARQCGFSGANYLCRVFRRQVGVTPAQFRARQWMVV